MIDLTRPPNYGAFLLTFWTEQVEHQHKESTWRFKLEDPHTRQQYGFASLEDLTAFLQDELNNNTDF